MPSRRINDLQVERLLQALHSRAYRQELARRISEREGIQYNSAMRRLQRYVTEAGEKRQFARSPALVRQSVRQVARHVPVPKDIVFRRPEPEIQQALEPRPRPSFFREVEAYDEPIGQRFADRERAREVSLFDLQGIVAYHDGDAEEAAQTLGVSNRAADLLDLATTGEGVNVLQIGGSGELIEPVREFFSEHEDADDVEDFISLIGNLPDWQLGLIMEDMQSGHSTFDDWLDRWREDNMIFRHFGDPDADDLEDSAYWDLWRATYARSKA